MQRHLCKSVVMLTAGLLLAAASAAWANNLRLANLSLVNLDTNAGSIDVQFDLSWENSWRASWEETDTGEGYPALIVTNWDAAWVFIKYRLSGDTWNHVLLAASGHAAPAGAALDLGESGAGTNVGAFIYRSEEGNGTLNLSNVRLRWNYADQGLLDTNEVDISVHAIEMVYIPQGPFWVGDSMTNCLQFEDGISGLPFRITSEDQITLGGGASGSLGNHNNIGVAQSFPKDDFSNLVSQTLPAEFPKGYNAFYCMKYHLTQGQFTEYLNQLTSMQVNTRFLTNSVFRQTIGADSSGRYTNAAPDCIAVSFDASGWGAYADWAGLRPMTELEFEKACRGPKYPVAGEYAWGDSSRVVMTNFSGIVDSGTETAIPINANCNSGNGIQYSGFGNGPVRAGIFATAGSTRAAAAAGYYGAIQLSGDAYEICARVGHALGRICTDVHGDGRLNEDGNTDMSTWLAAGFCGLRGGSYATVMPNNAPPGNTLTTSCRFYANTGPSRSQNFSGFRGVRTAP